jgi:hypothetical protein
MDPFLPVLTTDLNCTLFPPFRCSGGTSYLLTGLRAVSDAVSLRPLATIMASPPSDDSLLCDPQFAGLFQRLNVDASDVPSAAEVVDDYEGEQETLDLQSSTGENNEDDADNDSEDEEDDSSEEDAGDEASVGFTRLKNVVKNASKGVTEGTDSEYRRSEHTNCPSFLLICLRLPF